MEKCYSLNGDDWKDFECAIEQACEDLEDGQVFALGEGDASPVPISKFVCAYRLLEEIAEGAADNYGEYAEDFATDIDADKELVKELQSALEMVVSGWAEKHGRKPTFYDVVNVSWHNWKIVDAENYEVVAVHDE